MTAELVSRPAHGSEQDARLEQLRARMRTTGVDAAAFASPETIYYLTGLDHFGYFSFTLLVVGVERVDSAADAGPIVVARAMEGETIRAQLPQCTHVAFDDGDDPAAVASHALANLVDPGGNIAVEDTAMFFPPSINARIREALQGRVWHDARELLGPSMAVKDPGEIEHVRQAARISDTAMQAGIASAHTGGKEQDVAACIHSEMFSQGAQQPGFAPLIRPLWMLNQEHVSWGSRSLEPGTGLFIELSGCVARYHAPLCRTIYIGHTPDGAREAHGAAREGLEAVRAALLPGVLTGEVYAAWHETVRSRLHGDGQEMPQRHHCGYQVGIGFPPSWVGGGEVIGIRPGGAVPIEPGMTFHLMSWVTGHVVSDTALVTATGCELLTATSRELTVTT